MKIDTKPLQIGVDSIDVAGTWSQVDKADELMIASYEISDKQNDMLKALKAEREFLKNAMDFFKELFKLKPKQIEHIYKQVPGDTLNLYVSYVCGCVRGLLVLLPTLKRTSRRNKNRPQKATRRHQTTDRGEKARD